MGVAQAQEQPASAADSGEIVVTGSRIARDPNAVSPVPVQSIDAEAIGLSGEGDVVDVLNDIPALSTSTTNALSIDGVFSQAVGQSILNLRGLGVQRTLVLVDGRRHVAGVAGTATVDVSSIPEPLIDRVDVLTGGAGAVYGSDAVTGVVNFILKDDFDGFELNLEGGSSDNWDGDQASVSLVAGKNFNNNKGNIAFAATYDRNQRITFGDRERTRNNGIADDLPNPARRFQTGDISGATPNFAQFFSLSNGRFPTGFSIPSAAAFTTSYTNRFGVAPNLTQAELALIERAANAPTRTIASQPTFSISSNNGLIAPADFSDPGIDVDNNGVSDCVQSSVGFNSLFDFSQSFGAAGGCWLVDNGTLRPYRDGLISGVFNQYGGDGIQNNFDEDYLTPENRKYVANLIGHYDFTPWLTAFGDIKYAYQRTDFGGPLNTFYDLLTILPDNPFIPQQLQSVADNAGGLFITRDPTDLGDNISTNESRTYRAVGGFRGELPNSWNWEVAGTWGRYDLRQTDRNAVIQDRFFAAIDVTTDANGNPICRSDIDPTPPATTVFNIPAFDPGFFTFNPGDGQCRPANLFGNGAISREAVEFITATDISRDTLQQLDFTALLSGDSQPYFSLPAGPIGFAVGAEYRKEISRQSFSDLRRGVIPVDIDLPGTANDLEAGTLVSSLGLSQNSLLFDPESLIQNANGRFDVWEVFGEFSVPLLKDVFLAESLTVNGAVRYANYSTIGSALTWNVNGEWSPVKDVRFRVSYARPIRAPNVSELFDPDQAAFFRPIDPCDQAEIDALISSGDPRGPIRAANCQADGIPAGFNDPLSARFVGVTSGNRDLQEEKAKTFTAGGVIQPRFIPGLTITGDYWNIEIEDAIQAVSAQDIVDNCYDSANFPNQFCSNFSRDRDPGSPQFLGFNFLRQTSVNFARQEASGVDFGARYEFSYGKNDFTVGVSATRALKLDNFFDPGDPSAVDPELGELQRPRWGGNLNAAYERGPFQLGWQTQYIGTQALRAVEIETVDQLFGPIGIAPDAFVHDVTLQYQFSDRVRLYGGVNNLTQVEPYITEQNFPVSSVGRFLFMGVNFKL